MPGAAGVDANLVLIVLCSLVVLSHLFDVFARWSRIPSALLLIGTGILARLLAERTGLAPGDVTPLVHLLGTTGLVLIVLESAVLLDLSREKGRLILTALVAAQMMLLASTAAVELFLHPYLGASLRASLLHAIPLSVISSAIVLPSVAHLTAQTREFIVYEASFSDILGILLFNFVAYSGAFTPAAVAVYTAEIAVLVLLSLAAAVGLLFLTGRIRHPVKLFLIIALLVLLFSAGKIVHLSSLVLVLIFGLVVNNSHLLPAAVLSRLGEAVALQETIGQLKSLTAESAFLVRTFFFVIFGFSMDLRLLNDLAVFEVGVGVVLGLLLVRYLYLRYVLRTPLFPEIFLLPRGLVTILLFSQIPARYRLPQFNEGILFFVLIATSLLMMGGLLAGRERVPEGVIAKEPY